MEIILATIVVKALNLKDLMCFYFMIFFWALIHQPEIMVINRVFIESVSFTIEDIFLMSVMLTQQFYICVL